MVTLFTSNRPLERAENIHAVYEAYDGLKNFIQVNPYQKKNPALTSWRYNLRVADDFVSSSPGRCILVGHGFCCCKTGGLDQPYPYFRKENAKLLDYVLVSSNDLIDIRSKQCGVPKERVLPLGMPRTDFYFGRHKGEGGTFLAKKRAYLYAPTYRTREETPLPNINWDLIDGLLSDDEILVVKPHTMTRHILRKEYLHICEASYAEPSTPYLIDCDVLITDYSSIMIDAHILEKPVVLFEKQEGYLKTRGMYLDYPYDYASRYCTNEIDLVECIRDAKDQGREDIQCRQFVAGACDGHSTERVVELIRSMA